MSAKVSFIGQLAAPSRINSWAVLESCPEMPPPPWGGPLPVAPKAPPFSGRPAFP
jgi:hypothetical protein